MTIDDPRRPYPRRPVRDDDSSDVVDDAVSELIGRRAPMHRGDAGAELHALVSLIAEANSRLPRAIADARDQDHSWRDIAAQLAMTRLNAILRHGGRTARRRTPLELD